MYDKKLPLSVLAKEALSICIDFFMMEVLSYKNQSIDLVCKSIVWFL